MIRTAFFGIIFLAVVSSMVGCAGRRMAVQGTVDAMRREYLELEDRYYSLQNDYDRAQRELERLKEQDDSTSDDGTDADSMPPGPDVTKRSGRSAQRRDQFVGRDSETPTNDLRSSPEEISLLQGEPEGPAETGDEGAPWTEPLPLGEVEEVRDWRVTHLVINSMLTQGRDLDGQYGDDGISLIFEPRNADNQYVPIAGPVTISLIDPAESGEAQRIGLWHLTAEKVEPRIYNGEEGARGLQFKLPWQTRAPANRKLLVFVRFATPEGEEVEASNEITVLLPQVGLTSWSARQTPIMRVNYEESERMAGRTPRRDSGYSTGSSSVRQAGNFAPVDSPAPRSGQRPTWSPNR